jgi:hypothetical protein
MKLKFQNQRTISALFDKHNSKYKSVFLYTIAISRAVIDLLTGHNTLGRHLYLLGLHGSLLYKKCGVMEETSEQILCECEALASLRHAHLGSFFLEPKDIQSTSLGAV